MTKSTIKFGSLLAVMLIVSMALVPAVSAQAENVGTVQEQCNDCEEISKGTQISVPKVDSNVLQGADKAKFLKNTLKNDQFKEIKAEFVSRGYTPNIKEAKVTSLLNLDTGESGVRIDVPFRTGNESIIAITSTFLSDNKQETIGYAQNGDKIEILPHPTANQEISMQALWIPGYNYVGTYSLQDICYVVSGSCFGLFLLTVADLIPGDEAFVGIGCGVLSGGCWIVDTAIRYSSCDNPNVVLYQRSWWNPLGPYQLGYPTC